MTTSIPASDDNSTSPSSSAASPELSALPKPDPSSLPDEDVMPLLPDPDPSALLPPEDPDPVPPPVLLPVEVPVPNEYAPAPLLDPFPLPELAPPNDDPELPLDTGTPLASSSSGPASSSAETWTEPPQPFPRTATAKHAVPIQRPRIAVQLIPRPLDSMAAAAEFSHQKTRHQRSQQELHPDKSRLIDFGRLAAKRRKVAQGARSKGSARDLRLPGTSWGLRTSAAKPGRGSFS